MTGETTCFICGDSRPNSIEQHHIVPRRFGGSDDDENLVSLCASCHSAVEKLYDSRFYDELGVTKEQKQNKECAREGCSSTKTRKIGKRPHGRTIHVCEGHSRNCGFGFGMYNGACDSQPTHVIYSFYGGPARIRCADHATCGKDGCKSTETYYDPKARLPYTRCVEHFDNSDRSKARRRGQKDEVNAE